MTTKTFIEWSSCMMLYCVTQIKLVTLRLIC